MFTTSPDRVTVQRFSRFRFSARLHSSLAPKFNFDPYSCANAFCGFPLLETISVGKWRNFMEYLKTGSLGDPSITTQARSPLRARILLVLSLALLIVWDSGAWSENSGRLGFPICRNGKLTVTGD